MDKQLKAMSIADIKTYLRWQLISSNAPYLGSDLVQANFDFFGQTLNGVPQLKARWKRCVALVDQQLGEALGQEFVAQNFGPDLKKATLTMTQEIEAEMGKSIDSLTWMSDATKQRAQQKLHAIANKIGYPERWRDYASLEVRRGDALGNAERADAFEYRPGVAPVGPKAFFTASSTVLPGPIGFSLLDTTIMPGSTADSGSSIADQIKFSRPRAEMKEVVSAPAAPMPTVRTKLRRESAIIVLLLSARRR